jgi:hypothetical protein
MSALIAKHREKFAVTINKSRPQNSQAALQALHEMEGGPIEEPAVFAMGIEPELNRVVLRTNTFDQDLRHRLARQYGGLVVIGWDPFAQPAVLD